MRRNDPLISQESIAAIVVSIGMKLLVLVLTVVIGGYSFLNAQKSLQAQALLATPGSPLMPAGDGLTTPIIPPDTEWSKALSNKAQTDAALLTPAADQVSTPLPLPTPMVQVTPMLVSEQGTSLSMSSPLMGITLQDLPGTISQEFSAPPTGEDTGHHGVDFAFWSRGDQTSILGLPITSVFPGKIVSAFSEIRPPYGYLTVVETPLSALPQPLLSAIKLPPMTAPIGGTEKLACPTGFSDQWNTESQSLYVLYAHMNKPPAVTVGQSVNAGDVIGEVGNTGASSAPHLHLEMRIGPSNATFESIGHYDVSTTDQERHNYCVWRISGIFQMFNPMSLLTVQ